MTNYNDKVKTIYIDQRTLGLLDEVANNLSISRSALIRILINQYCKDRHHSFEDIKKQVDILTSGGGPNG